jgi:pimeloyl-ACP methyl ester carboxylesterase
MTPETHFANNDGVSIAYQVFGDGPRDLVYIPAWLSNLDIFWEEPRVARFLLELARFSRVIVIDRRGTGLSDRVAPPTLEIQMGDVTAVMDAAESRRAAFLGNSEGACMCMLFAATHPKRTTSVITVGGYAKWVRSEDYPYGAERNEAEKWFQQVENEWGSPIGIDFTTPSLANDEKHRHWCAKFHRSSASKADAIALLKMNADIDLRAVLPSVNVPTLVLQAKDDLTNSLESGRDFASRIPNAKLVEMECEDHVPWEIGRASCRERV